MWSHMVLGECSLAKHPKRLRVRPRVPTCIRRRRSHRREAWSCCYLAVTICRLFPGRISCTEPPRWKDCNETTSVSPRKRKARKTTAGESLVSPCCRAVFGCAKLMRKTDEICFAAVVLNRWSLRIRILFLTMKNRPKYIPRR